MKAYAKIALDDLTIEEAAGQVDDASYWDETMPPVVYHFGLSVADYWALTVKQHRLFVEWLENATQNGG